MSEGRKERKMSQTNTDHIVFLIGEEVTDSVERTRLEYPNLDIRAAHSDLACLHCGDYFPTFKKLTPRDILRYITAIKKKLE
jgi:hypothetical protein